MTFAKPVAGAPPGEPRGDTGVQGRTVIVTGGARGLGFAIALALGAAGARVVIADLALAQAREQAAELSERGYTALALPVDVGDEPHVRRLFDAVVERFGAVDAVINDAGVDVTAPTAALTLEQWARVVRTKLTGPFLMSKLAGDVMTRGGHIINIASTASKRAWPNAAAYHATKWGLLGLSHALHAELRPQGIKVSAVIAGGMRTPFLLDRFADIDQGTRQDPANVARAVLYLLTQPQETVVPEIMVLPMRETSWP